MFKKNLSTVCGLLLLTLMLSGCLEGGVSHNVMPGQKKNVELTYHFTNRVPVSEVQAKAKFYCNNIGSAYSVNNLRLVYQAKGMSVSNSEWDEWRFDCLTSAELASLQNNSTSGSSSNNSNQKIAKAKSICRELGFKTNSEKFADCSLKMMSLQFDTGNKISNNDGSTTQQIIVKQQDDFDVGDFFFGLQKIIDDNYRSTTNSSSTSSTRQNCKIYERQWGAEVVCQ